MNLSPLPLDTSLLVGRDRERALLRDRLDAALAGRGSLVLIGGEAGIGKSALAEAVCREATERGALVLIGRCYDRTETPPYGAFTDLFDHYEPRDDLPRRPALFSHWGEAQDATSKATHFAAARSFFPQAAAIAPLVFLLEDIQWADEGSLAFLRVLARSIATAAILILATYRTDAATRAEALPDLLPLLERESRAARILLDPLPGEALTAWVAMRYHLESDATDRLATHLRGRTDGNPLFITQLLRAIEEAAVLRRADGHWELGDLDRVGVPILLQQLIDGRVRRLGADTAALLSVAAVIGQEVPLALLAAVVRWDEERVIAAIEEAVRAHLLDATPDGARVAFVHALIRDALYESVLAPRRRIWHRTAGEVLARIPAADPDAVAYHFRTAGDPRAVTWLIRAGERARRASVIGAAMERFEAARALIANGTAIDADERVWLIIRLAQTCRSMDPPRSVAYMEEAAQLASEMGDATLCAVSLFYRGHARGAAGDFRGGIRDMEEGCAALDTLSPDERERIVRAMSLSTTAAHALLALHLAMTGQFNKVEKHATRQSPATLATDHWPFALTLVHGAAARPTEARACFRQACANERARGSMRQLALQYLVQLTLVAIPYYADDGQTLDALARAGEEAWRADNETRIDTRPPVLAWLPLYALTGHWHEIHRMLGEVQGTDSSYRAITLTTHAPVARARGDVADAWHTVQTILPNGPETEPGDTIYTAAVAMQRLAVSLCLDAGDLAQAHTWLAAHDRWLAWSGTVQGQAEGDVLWARYYGDAGVLDRAMDHAARALDRAHAPRQPLALLAAHRILGELARAQGQFDAAHTHLDDALALADACRSPYERALTLLEMAELCLAANEPGDARSHLAEADTILTALGAALDRPRADEIKARLSGTKPLKPAYPAGLTAREVEVLRLIAAGLSNPEAATQLSISPRTVGQHLRAIYGKFGVSSRAAASRIAAEYGLTDTHRHT